MFYLQSNILSGWKEMELEELEEHILNMLSNYEKLGPLPGVLLPFIEAFLPFLPLFVFVFANAVAYGLLKGFILSWLGSSLGSIAVFVIIRRLGKKRLFQKIRNHSQVQKVTTWLTRNGFGPLFLLLCFPFSPSSVINVVAGLSRISAQQFILAVLLGKSVMIFSISYIGSSIFEFAKSPVRTIIVIIGIVLFWIVGKYIEKSLQKKSSVGNMETKVN